MPMEVISTDEGELGLKASVLLTAWALRRDHPLSLCRLV